MDIIEDYIIFGGAEFLNCHSSSVAKLLDGIVGNVNDKGLLSIIPILDILIQVYFTVLLKTFASLEQLFWLMLQPKVYIYI